MQVAVLRRGEWPGVAGYAGPTTPAELAADSGVQLSMRHGRRLWTITAAGVRIDVTGGAENPGITQPILVSPRLVVLLSLIHISEPTRPH